MAGLARSRWPWISLLLSAVLVFNPVGLNLLHSAFFAGEQLARDIAQPIVLTALALTAVVIGLEWLVRSLIARSRARGVTR
ncbi:hypothetical protein [Bradyrhizobium uaiense]|uniref:Uncharacterized protein n=1 Tax=Bradyrhizobium uaiense TaxID=2594946 RepID=A0A6P1BAT2_9BRAD|nr:hypothetical protein [Bradyrhizobium uaiense]NEU94760.1 hypothetical protein [Bradyrhizobium uaiense]